MADKGKPAPERKDNRYLRAFRLIGDDATLTVNTIAKRASMSVSMATPCIFAWNAAVQVLDNRNGLAVKASDLVNNPKCYGTASQKPPNSEGDHAAAEAEVAAA